MIIDRRSMIESDAVRSALVADLAYSAVPTSIMGCTLVGIAIFTHIATGAKPVLAGAICGGLASAAKLVLMHVQRRRSQSDAPGHVTTSRWERAHAATTFLVASSVGMTATIIFLQPDLSLQMLATGLMFGYCAGVVSRVGIRPKIATTALTVTALPPVAAAVLWNDAPHFIICTVFLVFLLGSFETVRHVHQTAVRHVSMRLEMATLAHKDPLTGLANRIGLQAAFQEIRSDVPVAVLCLDLDGFKLVNDRYGHAGGDALLKMVAERLVAATAPDATIVRMGGDEFAVLQPGLYRGSDVADLALRISASLRDPFILSGEDVRIGASVGHAASSSKPADLDGLLARADEASYRVKSVRSTAAPVAQAVAVGSTV